MQSGSGSRNMKGKEVQRSMDGVNAGEGPSLLEDKHGCRVEGTGKADGHLERSGDGEEVKGDGIKAGEKPYVILKKRERKRKERNKDRFTWEEGNSQIFRLSLSHSHLVRQLYYPEYDEVVVYTVVGVANLLAYQCISYVSGSHLVVDKQMRNYDIIPFLMGLFAVYKIVRLLARVGWQSSTSTMSELTLSFVVGFIGFVLALYVLIFAPTSVLDFGFEDLFSHADRMLSPSHEFDLRQQIGFRLVSPMLAKILIASCAGLLSGILMTPAHRSVRSFWLGTDQLQWNIPVVKWGAIARLLLHLNAILPLFASLLWIKPMGELFIASKTSQQSGIPVHGGAYDTEGKVAGAQFWGKLLLPAPSDDWAQDFGVSRELFTKAQFWGLLVAGLLQLCLFRVNVQTYLNEAIIIWYESLHRSKVMNLELTRAKLLLNNYFLCRVAVQFFVPGMLVSLLLGMSRVWGNVPISMLAETSSSFLFLRVTALFMAWWVTFSWSIVTCVTLALYRTGFLLTI